MVVGAYPLIRRHLRVKVFRKKTTWNPVRRAMSESMALVLILVRLSRQQDDTAQRRPRVFTYRTVPSGEDHFIPVDCFSHVLTRISRVVTWLEDVEGWRTSVLH